MLRNLLATSSLFAATVLAAHASNTHNGLTEWGARLFYFWARVAYVLLYAAEVPLIHSLIWGTSRTSASCCSPLSSWVDGQLLTYRLHYPRSPDMS